MLKILKIFTRIGSISTNDGKLDLEIENYIWKTNNTYYTLYQTVFVKREINTKLSNQNIRVNWGHLR